MGSSRSPSGPRKKRLVSSTWSYGTASSSRAGRFPCSTSMEMARWCRPRAPRRTRRGRRREGRRGDRVPWPRSKKKWVEPGSRGLEHRREREAEHVLVEAGGALDVGADQRHVVDAAGGGRRPVVPGRQVARRGCGRARRGGGLARCRDLRRPAEYGRCHRRRRTWIRIVDSDPPVPDHPPDQIGGPVAAPAATLPVPVPPSDHPGRTRRGRRLRRRAGDRRRREPEDRGRVRASGGHGNLRLPVTFTLRDVVHKALGKRAARTLIVTVAARELFLAVYLQLGGPGTDGPATRSVRRVLCRARARGASPRLIIAEVVSELPAPRCTTGSSRRCHGGDQWARVAVQQPGQRPARQDLLRAPGVRLARSGSRGSCPDARAGGGVEHLRGDLTVKAWGQPWGQVADLRDAGIEIGGIRVDVRNDDVSVSHRPRRRPGAT